MAVHVLLEAGLQCPEQFVGLSRTHGWHRPFMVVLQSGTRT
jgi:hypothetical protein